MARFWRQTLRRIPSWDACLALAVPAGCAGMLAEAYGRTAIGDAEPAAACAFAPLALSAANAETLTRRGLVVVDNFLLFIFDVSCAINDFVLVLITELPDM